METLSRGFKMFTFAEMLALQANDVYYVLQTYMNVGIIKMRVDSVDPSIYQSSGNIFDLVINFTDLLSQQSGMCQMRHVVAHMSVAEMEGT